jgi:hypothetical protein
LKPRTECSEARPRTANLDFTILLVTLQPGKYACQVIVVDPLIHKTAFRQAPILVAPEA